jgi:hypothetical protein
MEGRITTPPTTSGVMMAALPGPPEYVGARGPLSTRENDWGSTIARAIASADGGAGRNIPLAWMLVASSYRAKAAATSLIMLYEPRITVLYGSACDLVSVYCTSFKADLTFLGDTGTSHASKPMTLGFASLVACLHLKQAPLPQARLGDPQSTLLRMGRVLNR